MAIFAISFRIHEDSTYEERYESLVDEIKNEAVGSTWEETTSFYVIKSTQTTSKSLCDDAGTRTGARGVSLDWDSGCRLTPGAVRPRKRGLG